MLGKVEICGAVIVGGIGINEMSKSKDHIYVRGADVSIRNTIILTRDQFKDEYISKKDLIEAIERA